MNRQQLIFAEAERKTQQIWEIFLAFVRLHHYSPSIQEIREEGGFSSNSVVSFHLHRLVQRGRLRAPETAGTLWTSARSLTIARQPGEPCPFCGCRDAEDES